MSYYFPFVKKNFKKRSGRNGVQKKNRAIMFTLIITVLLHLNQLNTGEKYQVKKKFKAIIRTNIIIGTKRNIDGLLFKLLQESFIEIKR